MAQYNPLNLIPLPPTRLDPKPVPTCITVDALADVLWVGTSSGIVSTYCSPSHLTPNVRFPAHGADIALPPGASHGVRSIRVTDRDVWTMTDGGIGGRKRGGASKWSIGDPTGSLRSMCANPANSHEVVAGGMKGLILANTSRSEITRKVDLASPVVHLSAARHIVSASLSGQISLLDPRTSMKQSQSVQAHTGGISGADAQGNLVATWGWTHMSGHPLPDPLVKLYDIRTLRALPPVSFPAGPAFALLHPTDPSTLLISSAQGTLQAMDMSTGSSGTYHQLGVTSYITSMSLSAAGDYLAFGDADGQVHLWTTHDLYSQEKALPPFGSSVKVEWPDQPDPPPQIEWTDQTPLNLVGMPHYTESLLSNFTVTDYAPASSPLFNPPAPIPEQILNTVKMVDFVGYATMPPELQGKRYVVSARPGAGKLATDRGYINRKESGPKFRSEKDKRKASVSGDIEEELAPGQVPKAYRRVEIKYSKFGIEDFDFDFYNQTEYSGLETDILNSYTNALLQALHYTTPLRAVAKGHICVDCRREHCLLCEAGFLFRMLEDAKGINCQASNFSRAFSATPQASALGLMDAGEKSTAPYGSLIQNLNRWLLSTFSNEVNVEGKSFNLRHPSMEDLSLEKEISAIDQVLGIQATTTITCQSCGFQSSRDSVIQTVDLTYPRKPESPIEFTDILQASIVRETSTKATCSNCKQFAVLQTRRNLASNTKNALPPVISINAMVASPELFEIWRDKPEEGETKSFLKPSVVMQTLEDGGLNVSLDGEGDAYDVTSMVVQIQESPDHPAHLVSFAKVSNDDWVLFNDFLVCHVTEADVLHFTHQWKTPAVIVLQRRNIESVLDMSQLPTQLDTKALRSDVSIAWNRRKNLIKHKVLDEKEIPGPGTLISIDAEFVALQQEEMEFRSDGTKNVLRPSHMSLARVSVLRGQDPKEGLPFIDDYIHTSEAVVDYLTEFSGIKNGDLDPNTSPHTLVPLKVAYKKLRLLVDLGCIFIGHGLAKDFRTINIFVPPEQVMDTVHLFTIPGRQRKLSLKFLTWFLLKKDIQTLTHDSIEDAKYALLLYKLYQQFEAEGRFEDVMEDIFHEGQKMGFKPPSQSDQVVYTGAQPSLPQQTTPTPTPQPQQLHNRRSHHHMNASNRPSRRHR